MNDIQYLTDMEYFKKYAGRYPPDLDIKVVIEMALHRHHVHRMKDGSLEVAQGLSPSLTPSDYSHDMESLRIDRYNGHTINKDEYLHEVIIFNSVINGQFEQAIAHMNKSNCDIGRVLDYAESIGNPLSTSQITRLI